MDSTKRIWPNVNSFSPIHPFRSFRHPLKVRAFLFVIALFLGLNERVEAQRFATQDLILFDSLMVKDNLGNPYNLVDSLVSIALLHPKDTAQFPGGGIFVNTDSLWGKVTNDSFAVLMNTTVQVGYFRYVDSFGTAYFEYAVLVTSNLTAEPETMGNGDYLEIDLDVLGLPFLQVGDTGDASFAFVQFLASVDTTLETLQTDIGLCELRAQDSSLVQIFSHDLVNAHRLKLKWVLSIGKNARMAIKTVVNSVGTILSLVPHPMIKAIGKFLKVVGAVAAAANLLGDDSKEPTVPSIPPPSAAPCVLVRKIDKSYECIDNGCVIQGKNCEFLEIHRRTSSYFEISRRCNCVHIPNGMDESGQALNWAILPNPSVSSAEIVVNPQHAWEGNCLIRDQQGKLVWSSGPLNAIGGAEIRLKTPELTSGIYLVELYSKSYNELTVKKLVILP